MAHLRSTMDAEGVAPVMPEHIHNVRWSPSQKKVLEKEMKHASVWNKHLVRIIASPAFTKPQKEITTNCDYNSKGNSPRHQAGFELLAH